MEVTKLEREMIQKIATSEYSNEPGDYVWTNCLAENHSGAAVLGSLIKKGLVKQGPDKGADATVALSPAGIAVWTAR